MNQNELSKTFMKKNINYLFIYLNVFTKDKTLLAISYFAYVPCFMTCIYTIYGNTYLNNYYMYNSYNNWNGRYIRHFRS